MVSLFLNDLLEPNNSKTYEALQKFSYENASTFSFPELNTSNVKERVWDNLFKCLTKSDSPAFKSSCLACIRILSRDQKLLENPCLSMEQIKIILDTAYLRKTAVSHISNFEVPIEAMKCLCNIIKNSSSTLDKFYELNAMNFVVNRIVEYENLRQPSELQLFDLRLLFLVTALNVTHRKTLCNELNGIQIMADFLEKILVYCLDNWKKPLTSVNDTEIMVCSEIFKIQFNLLAMYNDNQSSSVPEENIIMSFDKMVVIMKKILLIPPSSGTKYQKLQIDIINLLTIVPSKCCIGLILPEVHLKAKDVDINDPAMKPIKSIIDILDKTLTDVENKQGSPNESLSPVLMALLNLSKSHRLYRKYFRKIVLPHLTDVFRRPEEGNTLRNKLCRLLTSPVTSVSDLAASWLFVLCKEKVSRMVKYTGYGNSAGLFARHGFPSERPVYSSDSEDSDTEEYLSNKEEINPVVGCRMIPQPDPMKDMTEEQKEVLTMELVNSIDKLQRGGIIQPCKIGDDGRPKPIEHVLQLQPTQELHNLIDNEDH